MQSKKQSRRVRHEEGKREGKKDRKGGEGKREGKKGRKDGEGKRGGRKGGRDGEATKSAWPPPGAGRAGIRARARSKSLIESLCSK